MLSGSQGHGLDLCISLVDGHPGTKRFEMSNVEKLQVQPLGNMGSAMIIQVARTQPYGQLVVVFDRLERVHFGLREGF